MRTMPNGISSTYSYDENSRLTGIQTAKGVTAMDSAGYTHDNVGNKITMTTPQESWTYGYDNIYRLTRAEPTRGSHQVENYTYDQVGNRLTKTNEQAPQANEATSYSYDDENRLTKVTITRGTKQKELTFSYDPFGRRITKTITKDEIGTDCIPSDSCPRTTTYVYDNQSIIAEYYANNELVTRYTHGPNIDEPLAVEIKIGAIFTPHFYHADGLGSITSLSNANGTVIQRYTYDSFGNMTITTNGNINQPYTYTSREYDFETGMYFYRARYYDSKVGRFVTKDPIGFKGKDVNLYAYVANNAVNKTDPLGLWYIDINISGGFGLGVTGGIMINDNGFYPYVGGGLTTPGARASITWSSLNPSTGWNIGVQGQAGIAGQVGYGFGDGGGWFWEAGAGWAPGVSINGYYVLGPFGERKLPKTQNQCK